MRDGLQLCLLENPAAAIALDQRLWCHSFAAEESSLHSLAPYPHKARVDLVRALIDSYSQPGDVVLDPFCGSGVIPLEVALGERVAWASDRNPYAYVLTQGKLQAPRSQRLALQQVADLIDHSLESASSAATTQDRSEEELPPGWVQDFFHPETLRELLAVRRALRSREPFFLWACLLGILQDVRSHALSYPADPEGLFLRSVTYGMEQFPELYGYRDVRSRLIAKVKKVYRRHGLPMDWETRSHQVWQWDCACLAIPDKSVDTIITAPPCPQALDYVGSHRLRLWCLGYEDTPDIHRALISTTKMYAEKMGQCFREMARVLKGQGACVLLVSEGERQRGTVEELAELATTATVGQLKVETIHDDVPPGRESRKLRRDRILVLRSR